MNLVEFGNSSDSDDSGESGDSSESCYFGESGGLIDKVFLVILVPKLILNNLVGVVSFQRSLLILINLVILVILMVLVFLLIWVTLVVLRNLMVLIRL